MGSPFISSGIGALDSLDFMSRSAKRCEQVWENLQVSPRTAPSKGAKLCAYHHWFGRPSNLRFEPYYELPMRERERKFNLSIQPALAYEDVSMLESSAKLRMAAKQ